MATYETQQTSVSRGRVPPQALEAEQSVLGAMLLDREAVGRALEVIDEDSFYRIQHRYIFSSMVSLWERNEAIDLITVGEELKRANRFDAVGGATYLAELFDTVATSSNIGYHAKLIQEKWVLRKVIEVCTSVSAKAFEDGEDSGEILDEAERAIFAVSDKRLRKGFVSAKDMVPITIKVIEKLFNEKKLVSGLETGFNHLDRLTSGFQSGDLIIVAGRPSMGKTSLAMNIAAHAALRKKKSVGVFSLEMGAEQLLMRLLCSEARVNSERVRTGFLRHKDWPLLIAAAGQLSEAPMHIDDTGSMNVLELRAKARRLQAEHGLDMIVVDYLQLLNAHGRSESRQQEITEISRSLKALAKELKVPVVVLSQLSRAVDSRADHRPVLSDLRESGAIEQDADLVCFVFREEHYHRTDENEGIGEIIIGKQRNGPVGVVKVRFLGEYTRFETLEREQEEPF